MLLSYYFHIIDLFSF